LPRFGITHHRTLRIAHCTLHIVHCTLHIAHRWKTSRLAPEPSTLSTRSRGCFWMAW
jgi:hypothetical protein